MLKIIEQNTVCDGYNIQLDNHTILHMTKQNPTPEEVNELVSAYERDLLENIDLLGEEYGL